MLWLAFWALVVIVAIGVTLNLTILSMEKRQEFEIVQASAPLLDAMNEMGNDAATIVSAARGFVISGGRTEFLQQYDDAVRDFGRAHSSASQLATDPRDLQLVSDFEKHFEQIKKLTDLQLEMVKQERPAAAVAPMLETARIRRAAPDYAAIMVERHRRKQARDLEDMAGLRQWLLLSIVVASLMLIGGAAAAISRIERSLQQSINRQVRRTEAMIAGMSDGVMLVDGEGRTAYVNPAGEKLLGKSDLGIPIFKHAELYGIRNAEGEPIDAKELPAAQALATGRPIKDMTLMLARPDREIAIASSATPLQEDGRTTGVVVTLRDITERRRLEEEMQAQAERAMILADAGAFFSSNIDPVWVTQAIAERVAEVLGDWVAVILKGESNELRVASIYHRDMASLGLAWSYIYRQPLVVGEGIIGQVVASGYPSLTLNVGAAQGREQYRVGGAMSATPMNLASLLILPMTTRRETLGALVIAANDPDRAMTDDKLPLAEVLAERAALAVENAKLYTEQVEARRKVEDLSRLKDEFLSIASHELRTPVTSIKGYTQLAKTLIKEGDLDTSGEYLDVALDQIDRMSRLILELLDVSRIETGRLEIRREAIPWSQFVRDVVHRHHTSVSDRRFTVSVPNVSKIVHGDRDRLEQVLGNLLENAVKYSPEGSEIIISVEDRGDSVVTSVCDRGIGIPSDELAQVFERFHRGRQVSSTNYGGLGLGLYITKEIVERHGGSIWVDSREGSGTTFYFSLTAEPAPALASQTPTAPAASRT